MADADQLLEGDERDQLLEDARAFFDWAFPRDADGGPVAFPEDLEDEQLLAREQFFDLLLMEFGAPSPDLPAPWLDRDTPTRDRLSHAIVYATIILDRPHLAPDLLMMSDPDVIRGTENRKNSAAGGRASRKAPTKTPDVLRAAVLERRDRSNGASWTAICDRVGRAFGISGRTVRRTVPDTRW